MIAGFRRSRPAVVAALGASQTLAWASSYYLPAVLADPIAAGIGVPRSWFFAAFSAALMIGALAGPGIGRAIDRHGGRGVLALSNLVIALGLLWLAGARGPIALFGAWAVLGLGMALGLYDAGFATLAALYGEAARGPITGITLIAGFASTVGWPLSALFEGTLGWRAACLIWAAVNLVIALPINRFLLPEAPRSAGGPRAAPLRGRASWRPYREMMLLAFVFSAGWFVTAAMAAHLPALLQRAGTGSTEAIAAAALVGPAQVAARVAEFALLRRVHPLIPARVATLLHPLGAGALALLGPAAAPAFVILYGAGNGLLTIARGTVPLALFGPQGYGARSGLIGGCARAAQSLAPLLFGLLLDAFGVAAIAASAALCLAALIALLQLRIGVSAPGAERAIPGA